MGPFTRHLAVLASLIATIAVVAERPQAQASNPLAGGVWDRYSIKDAKGMETGSPGWFFLTFTTDGHYFITGVPKGHERLAKPAAGMTKDELVSQLQGIQVRRGKYTLTGNGSPYILTLTDDINPISPNVQGSCPVAMPCEIRVVNGEVQLSTTNGIRTRWHRVPGKGTAGS